jgi:heptosyltransferase-1
VLIVRIGAMGDVLHALPAVSALRALHPDWTIDWAIEPRWAPLLSPAIVSHVIPVEVQQWKQRPASLQTLREIAALRRTLHARRYDLCVDLQGTIRSSVVGWLAGASRRAGPAEPRERPARLLYAQKVPATACHVVEQACEILGAATGDVLEPGNLTLPSDPAAEAQCDVILRQWNVISGFVVLAPTTGWGAKQWPAARFGEVAAALSHRGLRVLINAARADDPIAAEVASASHGSAQVVVCSLPELIALERRAALVIAGDSGPMHLAAALRTPVVALFGPTDPVRNGPYGASRRDLGPHKVAARVLRHPSSVTDHARHSRTETGLKQISSDLVMAAAMDLLEATHRGRTAH